MTRSDVVSRAFRRIGVLAVDEALTASDAQYGTDVLESLWAEAIAAPWSIVPGFTLDDIPVKAIEPLALMVASEVASSYGVQAPMPLRSAMIRFRALTAAYARDQNLDEDTAGITTADEIETDKLGAWF